jgi:hypothetical protein
MPADMPRKSVARSKPKETCFVSADFFGGEGLQAVLDALQQEMATCELRSNKQQNTKF